MGIAERIDEVVRALPKATAAAVLDFAEAQRERNATGETSVDRRTKALALLGRHAGKFKAVKIDRASLHDRPGLR
jgi:hypothetical protein